MKNKFLLPLLFALVLPAQALQTDSTDNTDKKLHLKILARPVIAVADFGRGDFRNDIQNLPGFPSIELPHYAFGAEAQIGWYSPQKWGFGFEFSGLHNGDFWNPKRQKAGFSMNQWTLGAYGEYALLKREKFEIIGQLSAGVAFNQFHTDNFRDLDTESVSIPDYLASGRSLDLRQRPQAYVGIGFSFNWLVTKDFGIGFHVKWNQQIGKGQWYLGESSLHVEGISNSTLVPLQFGISLFFR